MKRVASVVMGLLAWGFTDGFLGGGISLLTRRLPRS